MADFQARVEGLTGLTIGTSPTTSELTEFLQEGLRDVVNRFSKHRQDELPKFCTTSSIQSSDAFIKVKGQILDVIRHHGNATTLRPCTQIAASLRYEATDTSSLHYKSDYNPGFYVLDGKLFTVPASNSS